jgi:hypothetical protein
LHTNPALDRRGHAFAAATGNRVQVKSTSDFVWMPTKFPVPVKKFPVPRNFFPVNFRRELLEKRLQHSGFSIGNLRLEPQNCKIPC